MIASLLWGCIEPATLTTSIRRDVAGRDTSRESSGETNQKRSLGGDQHNADRKTTKQQPAAPNPVQSPVAQPSPPPVAVPVAEPVPVAQPVSVAQPAQLTPKCGDAFELSPNGNDDVGNDQCGPFRTLKKLSSVLQHQGKADGRAIVYIRPGTYPAQDFPPGKYFGLGHNYNREEVVFNGYTFGSSECIGTYASVIHNVTIQSLQCDGHWAMSAVQVLKPLEMQNVLIRWNKVVGLGIRSSNVTLNSVEMMGNLNGISIGHWQGVGGNMPHFNNLNLLSNIRITNSSSHHNNLGVDNPKWAGMDYTYQHDGRWHVEPEWIGGGGKVAFTNGVYVENFSGYNNIGPGLWFDTTNLHVEVKNSNFYENWSHWRGGGIGLVIENSYGGTYVENNQFWGNDKFALAVWESLHTRIAGNHFNGGIVDLRSIPRPGENNAGAGEFYLQYTKFVHNSFGGGYVQYSDDWWHQQRINKNMDWTTLHQNFGVTEWVGE